MYQRVVLDSNVIIAGLRSRYSSSFEILTRADDGSFRIYLSVPLVLEYESVGKRQASELDLELSDIDRLVLYLCSVAVSVDIHYLWRPGLTDPKDDMVLEAAVAGGCKYIVTHNLRDFAGVEKFGVAAIRPRDFLELIGG